MDTSAYLKNAKLPATFAPLWDAAPPHSLGSAERDTPRLYPYLSGKGAPPSRAVQGFVA